MRLAAAEAGGIGGDKNIAVDSLSCCIDSIASQYLTPGISDRWKNAARFYCGAQV